MAEPEALIVVDGCSWVATWNYDAEQGPNIATGPLLARVGETWTGLDVQLLDAAREEIPILHPSYSLAWTVADPTIAELIPHAVNRWRFDLRGIQAGNTTVVFRILLDGSSVFQSGAIPLMVAGPPTGDATPSFVIKKNGVWTIIVLDGQLADGCDRVANPGSFRTQVTDKTDLYSVRLLDAQCEQIELSSSQYGIVFELADDCIAKVVRHPEHWDEILIFHINGVAVGETTVRMSFVKDGVVDFVSPPIPVVIDP